MNKNSFLIGGKHAVTAALKNSNRIVDELFISNNIINLSIDFPKTKTKPINAKIEKIFTTQQINHQGYIAKIQPITPPKIELILKKELNDFVILDEISDHRNIGSIFRTAAAFGINNIIVHKGKFNSNSPMLYKASSGAIEFLNIFEMTNLSSAIDLLKKNNFWIYALDTMGENINKNYKFAKKNAFILGSENNGIRKLTKKRADYLIRLPISKNIESLNVANSFACLMGMYK
jgi:23S rRNA (guanosine2251-2'-O)-methyltransferase